MFQGFSDAAIDFLWGVRFNNERSWFQQHKGEYTQYVYEPMKQLNAQLYQRMCAAYPKQSFLSKVARIYRDARRLHGQGPYRDHLWLTLQGPVEHWTDTPVFWFELSPDRWDYGLGVYCSQAVTAAKLRARMDADPRPMEKLTRKLDRQTEFALEGPEYARAKTPPSPLLAGWYNKKNWSLVHQEPISDVLYTPTLAERIFDGWKFLMPFYEYLSTVSGDPDPRL
jgi:uncharacterized protein (TIGR02453 family)